MRKFKYIEKDPFSFGLELGKVYLEIKNYNSLVYLKNDNGDIQCVDDKYLEEICGKSNCNRPKLNDYVYCQYHYDINFN